MLDEHLKLLADASLEVSAAEEALGEDAYTTASDRLDAATAVLAELRERWAGMSPPERAVVGPAAKEVRDRADAAAARVPKVSALSEGAPVADPEQDEAPAE
jgi:hypothetical protein